MESPLDMAERHCAAIARLTARGEALAVGLADDAEAAADPDRRERLALAFHRLCRGLRQAMLTEAKLARDARREAEEVRKRDSSAAYRRLCERKGEVRAALRPQVERHDRLSSELDRLMIEAEHIEGFADEPVEIVLERVRHLLDISEAALDTPSSPTGGGVAAGDGGGFPPDAQAAPDGGLPGEPPQPLRDSSDTPAPRPKRKWDPEYGWGNGRPELHNELVRIFHPRR